MIVSRRRSCQAATFLLAFVVLNVVFLWFYLDQSTLDSLLSFENFNLSQVHQDIRDYSIFFKDVEYYNPEVSSLNSNYDQTKALEVKIGEDNFLMSKDYLSSILNLPQDAVAKLEESHSNYIDIHMKKLVEKNGIKTFGNIQPGSNDWSEYEGSCGYVLVGGDRYTWLALLVIKQIRALGMKHPIELFIPEKSQYEADLCDNVLPKYNARCNLPAESLLLRLHSKFNVRQFQFKLIALLTSKFENVLYLDADGFPLVNLDYIFESDLYKEKNMLLWPDAWARTTNPAFYDIAGIEVDESKKTVVNAYDKKRVADEKSEGGGKDSSPVEYNFKNSYFHTFEGALPDPATEAGIMFINKTSHLKTLLLCLYYNLYGPGTYYSLLTQGAAGEGDKETFIAAATAMKEPYYQTAKGVKFCGYINKETIQYNSKSLGHYDPIETIKSSDPANDDNLKFIFMHLSYPKYFPDWLINQNELRYEPSGEHKRLYEEAYKSAEYDFDLRVFQIFVESICPNYYGDNGKALDGLSALKDEDYVGDKLKYLRGIKGFIERSCNKVFLSHLEYLKESTPEKYKHNIYRTNL